MKCVLEIPRHCTITKNTDGSGYDLNNFQTGTRYTDAGVTLSDNADPNPQLIDTIIEKNDNTQLADPAGSNKDIFDTVASEVGFWEPGDYSIVYTAKDDFNNTTDPNHSTLHQPTEELFE